MGNHKMPQDLSQAASDSTTSNISRALSTYPQLHIINTYDVLKVCQQIPRRGPLLYFTHKKNRLRERKGLT